MLTTADLIYPVGELQESMFPDRSLAANVTTWLAEKPNEGDTALTHWVYYRAYQAIANRIAVTPNSESYFNDVSRSWGKDRVDYFQAQADKHLAEYNRLTGSEILLDQPARMIVFG